MILSSVLSNFFFQNGVLPMSVITILLALLLLAEWKAPKWVKETGIAALLAGLFFSIIQAINLFDVLSRVEGGISPGVLFSGLKIMFTRIAYGMFVYAVSLVLRIINKSRI